METFIFGAGYNGKKALEAYKKYEIYGFIDNNRDKQGRLIEGVRVFSLSEVIEKYNKESLYIIIACRFPYSYAIEQQLKRNELYKYELFCDEISSENVYRFQLEEEKEKIGRKIDVYENKLKKSINNIVVAGINTDDINYGCRATSTALLDILEQRYVIKSVFYRYELLDSFDDMGQCIDILDYYIREKIYHNALFLNIFDKLNGVDALVINGEGSFIFRKNTRKDLFVFCSLILFAIEKKIPFYVVNFMISGEGNEKIESIYFESIMNILSKAQLLVVRDWVSYEIANNAIGGINIKYIPDALFANYYKIIDDVQYIDLILKKHDMLMPFVPRLKGKAIQKKYVVLSGNSGAAAFQMQARDRFDRLTIVLKETLSHKNIQLVLMECCAGDVFLRDIALKYDLTYVPSCTNLNEVSVILQNAKCFVSGRYHPSIIASLGGTPCVFMDSNSHKTISLQKVLEYEDIHSYSILPSDKEIAEIAYEVKQIIDTYDNSKRKLIKEVCNNNAGLTKQLANLEVNGRELL